jgi:peroxiredoxin
MTRIEPGTPMPAFRVRGVSGEELSIGRADNWELVVVYRGKHCPLCSRYLSTLNRLLDDFRSLGIRVIALSADPREKAESQAAEESWRFPIGYDLTVDQMRLLGLYVSAPRSPKETDRPFSEPGLFLVNPQGRLHVVDVSNAPFARPDLQTLLDGLRFLLANDYPVRGTLV